MYCLFLRIQVQFSDGEDGEEESRISRTRALLEVSKQVSSGARSASASASGALDTHQPANLPHAMYFLHGIQEFTPTLHQAPRTAVAGGSPSGGHTNMNRTRWTSDEEDA